MSFFNNVRSFFGINRDGAIRITTCEVPWNWGAWHQHLNKLFKTGSASKGNIHVENNEASTSEQAAGMGKKAGKKRLCHNIRKWMGRQSELVIVFS